MNEIKCNDCGRMREPDETALAAEVARLRSERDTWQSSAREWESYAKRRDAELDQMGKLPFEAAFLIDGEPEQLIFRGPTGQVVLRRVRAALGGTEVGS